MFRSTSPSCPKTRSPPSTTTCWSNRRPCCWSSRWRSIAGDVATWSTSMPARLQRLLPCTPASAGDADCFGRFLQGFGKRVLRRPLDQAEVQEMLGLLDYAKASGRFADGVAVAVRLLLMHPEFIYRVEPGLSVSGRQDPPLRVRDRHAPLVPAAGNDSRRPAPHRGRGWLPGHRGRQAAAGRAAAGRPRGQGAAPAFPRVLAGLLPARVATHPAEAAAGDRRASSIGPPRARGTTASCCSPRTPG